MGPGDSQPSWALLKLMNHSEAQFVRGACDINGSLEFMRAGAPLPGKCVQNATTKDSRIWGPPTWRDLHLMAQNWPKHPDNTFVSQCVNFMRALPYMIPCGGCGYHAIEFDKLNDQHDD